MRLAQARGHASCSTTVRLGSFLPQRHRLAAASRVLQPCLTNGSIRFLRLAPTASTLGGIQSATPVSHQWISSISTAGVPSFTQPAFTDVSGTLVTSQLPALIYDKGGAIYNVKAYGAVGNVNSLIGVSVSISSGSAALTVSGASFTSGDVGKGITVTGAGGGGGNLVTTISAYTSATQVTLASNASTTLSSSTQNVIYGTDDTSAAQAAFTPRKTTATTLPHQEELFIFLSGRIIFNSQTTYSISVNSYCSISIEGAGLEYPQYFIIPNSSGISISLHNSNQSFHVRDMTITTGTNLLIAPNYTGLSITGPNTSPGTENDISNVAFRGLAASTWYWQTSISAYGIGLIDFNNLWFASSFR